jgi:putative intracellular protease/amidase
VHVVALVYDGVVSREVLGPLGPFEAAGATCELQSADGGSRDGFDPYESLESVPFVSCAPDVLIVPGGFGWRRLASDPAIGGWLTGVAGRAGTVLAVSTGSLLLDALGLVEQRTVTGHWLSGHAFEQSSGVPALGERIVDTGWLVTAAGAVSAMRAATGILDRATDAAELAPAGQR